MTWRRYIVWAGDARLTGCAGGPATLISKNDHPVLEQWAKDGDANISRSQKPEADRPANPIQRTSLVVANSTAAVETIALVNGLPIFKKEVLDICMHDLHDMSTPTVDRVLHHLIEQELVVQEIRRRLEKNPKALEHLEEAARKDFEKQLLARKNTGPQIKSDDDLKQILSTQGRTLEGFRRGIEREFMYREFVRSMIMPILLRETTHKKIEAYYYAHPSNTRSTIALTAGCLHLHDAVRDPRRSPSLP